MIFELKHMNMLTMKKTLIAFALILAGGQAFGQQDPMVSQYMFNGLFLNPAYAGSHPYFSSTLSFRKQWVNFEGAPQTAIAAVDGPLTRQNMGLGLILMNDQIGVTRRNDFVGNYSYHIKLNKTAKLSLGVSAGLSQYKAELTKLQVWDTDDQVFVSNIASQLIPKFGFGAYVYDQKWYAGFSIPTLFAYQRGKNFSMDVNQSTFLNRHYFLTGGLVIEANEKIKLKPSMLVKYLPNAPVQVDINFSVLFQETIWTGISYRTGDAILGIVEYQANNRFRVAYAYDLTLSRLRKYNAGSHEIMIGFDFGKDYLKVKTPRYF
jgi:type IX secretion system PorP/SprF family membrane protein